MTYFESWGHFSQVVWKGSMTVGCASQFCAAGTIFAGFESWFTVCNVPQGKFHFLSFSFRWDLGRDEVELKINADSGDDIGNYIGEFGVNVGPPLGQPTIPVSP
jgi:hypothetical protein